MSTVRPIREEDIPQIVDINTRLFPKSAVLSRKEQEERFRTICFNNPFIDPDITSLVYAETDGTIRGFLGVTSRTMMFGNRRIRVAVGQHLMVEKSVMGGLQLFREFFAGPQDLTFTDRSVDAARPIWERMGGRTSYTHSMYWRRPLRPSRALLGVLQNKFPRSVILSCLSPCCRMADAALSLIPWTPFNFRDQDTLHAEELSVEMFLHCAGKESSSRKLRPLHTPEYITWLFGILGKEQRFGQFRKILLRDQAGEPAGWYIANMKPGGICETIQIAGKPKDSAAILRHMFLDAYGMGCVEAIGRLDPNQIMDFRDTFLFYAPGRNWMLVHSKDPEILYAIDAGDVYLTRLEGDLWLF